MRTKMGEFGKEFLSKKEVYMHELGCFIGILVGLIVVASIGGPLALIIVVAGASIASSVARKKGRDGWTWYLYGAWFLIFAIPHAFALDPLPDTDTKTCPQCAETIKAAAVVCRFCNADLAQ